MKTFDKAGDRKSRSAFIRAKKAEARYAIQLRKIARVIGDIASGYTVGDPSSAGKIEQALRRYSNVIGGWAETTALRMLEDVSSRDRAAWMEVSRRIGQGIAKEIESAPTGAEMRERLQDQVKLIKSLPEEAADRVREISTKAFTEGRRPQYVAEEIMRSGDVAKSRANTIARTEVSRTGTELTRARAEYVGSEGYIWRTAEDEDVRHSHEEMNGKFVRWDSPPTLDGMKGHAGQFPNCRCYPEPVIPGDEVSAVRVPRLGRPRPQYR